MVPTSGTEVGGGPPAITLPAKGNETAIATIMIVNVLFIVGPLVAGTAPHDKNRYMSRIFNNCNYLARRTLEIYIGSFTYAQKLPFPSVGKPNTFQANGSGLEDLNN